MSDTTVAKMGSYSTYTRHKDTHGKSFFLLTECWRGWGMRLIQALNIIRYITTVPVKTHRTKQ